MSARSGRAKGPGAAQPGPRRPASPAERAFLGAKAEVVTPGTAAELGEALREAAAGGGAVRPAGLGAHAGESVASDAATLVSAAALADVLAYEPDDFTIGVGAGMPLSTLRETLAEHGQEVPADLPEAGTVGGLVARGHASPRQSRHGNLTTLVLGVEGVRTTGEAFRSGGMVVKNVAGYPLHKFVVGSRGRAGALTRVNLRLRQIPEVRSVRVLGFDSAEEADELVTELRESRLEPVLFRLDRGAAAGLPFGPAGCEHAVVRIFEGSAPRVAWLDAEAASREPDGDGTAAGGPEATATVLAALVAAAEPPEDPGAPVGIVRLSVPPHESAEAAAAAREALVAAGAEPLVAADAMTGLVTLRWSSAAAEDTDAPLAALRNVATAHRGAARLLFLPPPARARWPHGVSAGTAETLRERLFAVFDPAGALR